MNPGEKPLSIRTVNHPMVRWAGRQLNRLNERHPWDHNQHFHRWLLRHLPQPADRVLDVGCGRGDLVAQLRFRAAHIDGIDPDPTMAYASATRFRGVPGVEISRRGFEQLAAQDDLAATFDAITMVATLHHMDLADALTGARRLLRPGGVLLIVTLVRPDSLADQLWDVGCALSNPLIGLVKHPRPARGARSAPRMPLRDPELTLADLRESAGRLLPGAQIRRRTGFRVTLRWQKPGGSGVNSRGAR